MTARFLHTADWQLGKPFAGIEDPQARALVQQERLAVIGRLREAAQAHGAGFIVIAGDLFDSPGITKATVSAACSAIGSLGIPVFAIPGNHDHAGPGSVWEQEFFRRECASLAPNLRLLLEAAPVEIDSAVLLPCPLLRRAEAADTTAWLRHPESLAALASAPDKPRIVLAHGSVQGFGEPDAEEYESGGTNRLDLERLPVAAYDYLALGDWHGMKQVGPRAWYSGTPELDRFPKGTEQEPGFVLAVTVTRGSAPEVTAVRTARLGWHRQAHTFTEPGSLERLEDTLQHQLGSRTQSDLLQLDLDGALGLEEAAGLEELLERWRARLLRLKIANRTVLAPSEEELAALTRDTANPVTARVAAALLGLSTGAGEEATVARLALRELHTAGRSA